MGGGGGGGAAAPPNAMVDPPLFGWCVLLSQAWCAAVPTLHSLDVHVIRHIATLRLD